MKYKKIITVKKKKNNDRYIIPDPFNESVLEIKEKLQGYKIVPYIVHNCFPYDSGGYATRTFNLVKAFNELDYDKKYIVVSRIGYPYDKHKIKKENNFKYEEGGIFFLTLPKLKKKYYNKVLDLLRKMWNFNTVQVASAWNNAEPIIKYCNNNNNFF